MRRLLFAIAILLALAVAAWFVFRTRFAADFGTHRRGYGDTILRYEDRGYDGAKWEKLPEGEAARIAASPPNENSGHFGAIRGWDDDNYWITTDQRKAVLFRVREGTWSIAGAFEDAHESQFLRVEAPDRALFAACNTWNGAVWEVSPAGIRRLYDLREAKTCNPKEIVAVAPDLRVVTTIRPVLQIAGARTEAFDPDVGRKELRPSE